MIKTFVFIGKFHTPMSINRWRQTIVCRVLTMSQVLEYLLQNGRITEDVVKSVQVFVRDNQLQLPTSNMETEIQPITIPIRQRFEKIRKEKKSNLCLSADLTSLDEIIEVIFWYEEDESFRNSFSVSETSWTEYLHVENSLCYFNGFFHGENQSIEGSREKIRFSPIRRSVIEFKHLNDLK